MDEVIFGNRVLMVSCYERGSKKMRDYFFEVLKKHEDEILGLMDEYNIPPQVIIHFRKGDHTLDGIYRTQSRIVSKHLIVVEIFTEKWASLSGKKIDNPEVEKDLIHTFVHELIHHRYADERMTEKKALMFLEKMRF